jgi:hypothetical protein
MNKTINKTIKNINSNLFNFNFFLSNNTKVNSLESGAMSHGGATKYNDGIYSNIEGSDYITINESNNKISIFIPDTMDVNTQIDNEEYIQYSIEYIQNLYKTNEITSYQTQGSWYSDDMQKVVYDNITIISIDLVSLNEVDIKNFITLAEYIKLSMNQEGVSISINESLAIV